MNRSGIKIVDLTRLILSPLTKVAIDLSKHNKIIPIRKAQSVIFKTQEQIVKENKKKREEKLREFAQEREKFDKNLF